MTELSLNERADLIKKECLKIKSTNVAEIFERLASKDFIRIHGPEHHTLDGAVLLTAFYNAGGKIDLSACLDEMVERGLKMPGAICAKWGVCGAVSSVGAALSIIDGTQPLSLGAAWGEHMSLTSKSLYDIGKLGGPRCCKRDAYITLNNAIDFVNDHYGIRICGKMTACRYSSLNAQCKGSACPFNKK